jgi:predicted phosphodiesterase
MSKFSPRFSWVGYLLALLLAPACDGSTPAHGNPVVKMLVFSDPHYFDPSLGTTGAAFEAYLQHDRKLIAESDAIMRAMVQAVLTENPQVVLVPGDLTKDGELLSHQSVAGYLAQMQTEGRKVFVVPGNHDIQNGSAVSYAGDVATPVAATSAAQFAEIYQNMGFAAAIHRDPDSLSYVAEVVPGLRLLAVDSCIYGDAPGSSAVSGRLLDATTTWIQAQLDEAKQQGSRVIGMMHHGVVEHFGGQAQIFPEYLVAERDAVASLFSSGGMGVVFTGHFHANDITQGKPSGSVKSIFDVETGSAATYPCPYRIVNLAGDSLAITTQHIEAIDYDLQGAPSFQDYAHASLRVGLEGLITSLVQAAPYSMSATDAAQVAPWLGDGLVAHYVGDEVMPAEAQPHIQTLMAAPELTKKLAGAMLQSIWTDLPPPDNMATFDLAAR